MLLFRSEEHVKSWYQNQGIPTGAILSLEQQWELARLWVVLVRSRAGAAA